MSQVVSSTGASARTHALTLHKRVLVRVRHVVSSTGASVRKPSCDCARISPRFPHVFDGMKARDCVAQDIY